MIRRRLRELARDERGGVLVIFTVFLPVLLALSAFVIDVGNWFEHKKHLQLQVDAGALAGGLSYRFPCTGTIDAQIEAKAREYAGDPGVSGAFNPQVPPTAPSNVHILVNSTDFWNEGGTDYSDGTPCGRMYLDVKGTESNLPWFFGLASQVVPAINAEARVALQQANALGGILPIGVRDVDVKTAAVIFVNDTAPDTVLAKKPLTKTGTGAGMTTWSNAGDKASVTVATRTSAIIALSSRTDDWLTTPTTTSAICNQRGVDCYYDAGGATFTPVTGLSFVRGYPTTPACCLTTTPQARAVRFVNTTAADRCADPYFFYRASSSCRVRIRATMDFAAVTVNRITVNARTGATCPNNFSGNLTAVSGNTEWEGDITGLAADAGPIPITLCVEVRANGPGPAPVINGQTCTNTGSNPCKYTISYVHQAFSGNDTMSGPIRNVKIWNGDTSGSECYWATCSAALGPWANAFPVGSPHLLYVDVQVAGALSTSTSDPITALRVARDESGGGSGNQVAIDCEQSVNLRSEIRDGCRPMYEINTRQSQPDPCDPPYGSSSASLWASPQPWQCVAVKPGGTVGQFSDGINERVFGTSTPPGTCPTSGRGANNWSLLPSFPDDDPRIIQLFMVPFGSFRDTGADQIFPVVNFGVFYVRDWGGTNNSRDDPCGELPTNPEKGYLYGNFIKYIVPSGAGTGGGTPCDPSAFAPCLPVLVK